MKLFKYLLLDVLISYCCYKEVYRYPLIILLLYCQCSLFHSSLCCLGGIFCVVKGNFRTVEYRCLYLVDIESSLLEIPAFVKYTSCSVDRKCRNEKILRVALSNSGYHDYI